ncbi:efflux RND transporter periplasmic adaptor subunit [Albibacterium sp.]|uniref:efflux RND transporter periplasmic adaptor subunit n=1 Tax=Albibacterium sp. TaxID=2952885 RepID=UPI002C302220|nr:efflux RND transporter periplasmic adaptor subunit [Albibacterium sp.]HUH19405.1 efflux RND transporter periplasmic adaptor subunit [Albibacterium sp.]
MKNIVIIFAFLTLLSCGAKENTTAETAPSDTENILQLSDEQLQSFTLSSVGLQEKNITKTLKLNGKIDVPPQNLASVSSALGGYVKSTKLLPGMHFRKGEVIAVMEDNQFIQLQQDYLTAKVQLANSEAEYLRQSSLNQSKASSDKVYLQAKADYQTLLISQRSLEQKLKLIHINPEQVSVSNIRQTANIYAPFDGFVSQVFVNVGKYVSPSDVLFELVNPNDLHLNLKVFEKDWDKIKIGQPLLAYTNSNPGKKYNGEIILIGKSISADRAVEVHAHFKESDGKLIPGMYMNADVEIPESSTWALPEESIVSFEGKQYVFEILDRNRFRMISVQTGNTGNRWIEIINDNQLNNKNIAQKGAYTLLMALKNKAEE